ncbi:hypothetical protein F2Q69_00035140 [Brassica cretica]|uniref:Uncharacterized protein n=1 Tax=Brassica cretica TaxID=69181 RepID=A0A8S9SSI8_BRACR|nr:hypothetical protein F2Q69_00035140 [Brassica cretica]
MLPPFPLMPDMSTRPEEDFQRVVVDALTAIWARVSRCRCSSRRSVRASSPSAVGATPRRPPTRLLMRTSPHISILIYLCFLLLSPINTLQQAHKFSVSAPSIDEEVLTSIDGDALLSIDNVVCMSIDIRDRGV